MKKILFSSLFLWMVCMANAQTEPATFNIDHGPYLQEVTPTGATFVFNTSRPSLSGVELRETGSEKGKMYYQTTHGLHQANVEFFSVRANNLKPGTTYEYRIHAKEMKDFQPYKVTFGSNIVSPWYRFSTVNPAQKGGSIFIVSDIHSRPAVLKQLLENCDYRTCTAFFYAGDMMNYMKKQGEHPFTSFIDTSVDLFAKSVPFELVRGNHETRGDLARLFPSFFPKSTGKLYGSYLLGDVMIIMLDSGEDKAESHPVYAGLTDFENYRTEQAEWLKRLVESESYLKARYHIVISHFPMVMDKNWQEEKMWYGWQDAIDKFLPILNKAKVDLLVSGHTHRYFYHPETKYGNKFPVLEQGYDSATRLDIKNGKIRVKVIDKEKNTLLDKTLEVK